MKRIGVAAALAVALVAISITSAHAQAISTYAGAMMDQLRAEILRRETAAPAGEGDVYYHGEVSSLNDDQDRTSTLIANWGGAAVTVVGFCDSDCADLDLFVTDETGAEVVSDAAINGTPVVTFIPDAKHSYQLRVRMYVCNTSPCFYSVGAFYKR